MNKKILLFGFLVVVGLADAFFNGWAFLLNRETIHLGQAIVGILIMILSAVQLRREMSAAK